MLLRRAALVASALCLLPALAACGGGVSPHAGDVVPARQDEQFAHDRLSKVALPIGTLEIHAGAAVDKIPAGDTRELTAQQAPSGMTYLPITWGYDKRTTTAYKPFVATAALPVVSLRAGDATYRLQTPDPGQGAESFYALIRKTSDKPSLDVAFDGVTQTVNLATGARRAGRAAPLYRLKQHKPTMANCRALAHWAALAKSTDTCKVSAPVRLPYAGGKWAPKGHRWLVLSLSTSLSTYTQAGTTFGSGGIYAADRVRTSYRLGKQKPVKVMNANSDNAVCPVLSSGACNTSAVLVFDDKGSDRTLTLVQRYHLVLATGWGGFTGAKKQTVPATVVVPLKPAS